MSDERYSQITNFFFLKHSVLSFKRLKPLKYGIMLHKAIPGGPLSTYLPTAGACRKWHFLIVDLCPCQVHIN